MRLLPPEAFAHVFQPLQGRRIGYVRPSGNVGDDLIEWATCQLFDQFDIRWRLLEPHSKVNDIDEIVYGGGGNMGGLYLENWHLRSWCLETRLPVTIFPQSFTSLENRRYQRTYVRERASLSFAADGTLAPDLALGLDYETSRTASRGVGVFLRKDVESSFRRTWMRRDPVKLCRTPLQYLELAARYQHVITDRLHFAICGLIVGRRTTLLPNSYHKNQSMYETWLRDLGCEFAQDPSPGETAASGGVSPRVDRRGGTNV